MDKLPSDERKRIGWKQGNERLCRVLAMLRRKLPIAEIARRVGWTKQKVWDVKNGQRGQSKAFSVAVLGLVQLPGPKLCRRCGNPHTVFARSRLCVGCEFNELIRHGLIVIPSVETIPEPLDME